MPTENKPAELLKVERSIVTKMVITGAPSLDPITVFLEDLAPCKGKITVSCWGKSWTAYWGGMWDGLNIGQFVCELNTSYIIGNFDQALRSRKFSGDALANEAKRLVLKERRRFDLTSYEARELFDAAEDLRESPSIDHLHALHSELMTKLFGDEWWHMTSDATEPNPITPTSSESFSRCSRRSAKTSGYISLSEYYQIYPSERTGLPSDTPSHNGS